MEAVYMCVEGGECKRYTCVLKAGSVSGIHVCWRWAVEAVYMCVEGCRYCIGFYDFPTGFWKCFGEVVFSVFHCNSINRRHFQLSW